MPHADPERERLLSTWRTNDGPLSQRLGASTGLLSLTKQELAADAARRLPARRRNRPGGDSGRDRRPPRAPDRDRGRGAQLRRARDPRGGHAASRADARGVPERRRRRPRRGRPPRARGRSGAAGAGPDRPPARSRRLREPASRHRPRHRPADRPRARRRPLLRRQRPAARRLRLRHLRVHAGTRSSGSPGARSSLPERGGRTSRRSTR